MDKAMIISILKYDLLETASNDLKVPLFETLLEDNKRSARNCRLFCEQIADDHVAE